MVKGLDIFRDRFSEFEGSFSHFRRIHPIGPPLPKP